MSRFRVSLILLLGCLAGFLLSLNGCSGGGKGTFISPPPPSSSQYIKHVVVISRKTVHQTIYSKIRS